MAKVYCANCGEAVEGAFCGTCGTAVSATVETSTPQQTYAPPGVSVPSSNAGSGRVSFGQAIALLFKNYVNFNGRASQSEYWFGYLFFVLAVIAFGWVDGFISLPAVSPLAAMFGARTIPFLALLLPLLSLGVRRLHDTGRSGHYLWFGLIPFVGGILLLVWLAGLGEPNDNRFGPRR